MEIQNLLNEKRERNKTLRAFPSEGRKESNSHNEKVLVANRTSSSLISGEDSTCVESNKPPVLHEQILLEPTASSSAISFLVAYMN